MFYKDYIRVLNINLSTGRIRVDKRKDLRAYLGGVELPQNSYRKT